MAPLNPATFPTFVLGTDGVGGISIQGSGSMTVSGFLGTASSNVTLLDSGVGASISGAALITGKTVLVQTIAGDIGTASQFMQINSPNASVNTNGAGNVFLNSPSKSIFGMTNSNAQSFNITTAGGAKISNLQATGGNIVVTVGKANAILNGLTTLGSGDINVSTGSTATLTGLNSDGIISATTGGATTIGNLTSGGPVADGGISISNSTGLLQTSADAKIYAVNGQILLVNNNIKSGSILIGVGSDIETGVKPFAGAGGAITISIGQPPIPASSPSQQGVAPATSLVTAVPVGSGVIDWVNGITAVVSKLGPNTVTAKNTNVIFNTATLRSTAIKLNGDVTIVGDPPANSNQETSSSSPSSINEKADVSSSMIGPMAKLAANQISLPEPPSWSTPSTMQAPGALLSAQIQRYSDAESLGMPPTGIYGMSSLAVGTVGMNGPAYFEKNHDSAAVDDRWLTETEIESGDIPAILYSDKNLGLIGSVSSVLNMTETTSSTLTPQRCINQAQRNEPTSRGMLPKNYGPAPETRSEGLTLSRGSVLFAPTKHTTVETPFGSISIASNSLVLVLIGRDRLAVYDFHDTHAGAVKLSCDGNDFALSPGRHALISGRHFHGFGEANAAQLLSYRNVRQFSFASKQRLRPMQAFTSDFHLPTAIVAVLPIGQLVRSRNPRAAALARQLLKTVAIISALNNGGEQYLQMTSSTNIASR